MCIHVTTDICLRVYFYAHVNALVYVQLAYISLSLS